MKITRWLLLLLILPVFWSGIPDSADSGWELRKSAGGIEVYTRPHGGTGLKEVRVLSTAQASVSSVVALLLDSKNYPGWVYDCKEARTLKVISDREYIQYQVTKLPSPMSDRDVVTHLKISQDAASKIVSTLSTGTPEYMPPKLGCVRVQHFQSSYKLTPLPGAKVRIQFELFVDPGGDIPKSFVNTLIIKGPYNTTVAMAEQLKKPQYKSAAFGFIKEEKR